MIISQTRESDTTEEEESSCSRNLCYRANTCESFGWTRETVTNAAEYKRRVWEPDENPLFDQTQTKKWSNPAENPQKLDNKNGPIFFLLSFFRAGDE